MRDSSLTFRPRVLGVQWHDEDAMNCTALQLHLHRTGLKLPEMDRKELTEDKAMLLELESRLFDSRLPNPPSHMMCPFGLAIQDPAFEHLRSG